MTVKASKTAVAKPAAAVVPPAPAAPVAAPVVPDGRESGPGVRAWLPTWKWWSSTVVGATGLGTAIVLSGHWTRDLSIAAITLGSQRLVAYITPNAVSPDSYGTG